MSKETNTMTTLRNERDFTPVLPDRPYVMSRGSWFRDTPFPLREHYQEYRNYVSDTLAPWEHACLAEEERIEKAQFIAFLSDLQLLLDGSEAVFVTWMFRGRERTERIRIVGDGQDTIERRVSIPTCPHVTYLESLQDDEAMNWIDGRDTPLQDVEEDLRWIYLEWTRMTTQDPLAKLAQGAFI